MKRNITSYSKCDMKHATSVAGSRWKVTIIHVLRERTMRFGQIQAVLGSISTKVLSTSLKELEAEGILVRNAVTPSRVEYALTERGRALWPILTELVKWNHKFYTQPKEVAEVA